MTLSGKTAVVTGGSRGIGRAICLAFAKAGANIVFSYAGNEQAAEETLSRIEALGAQALCIKADAASEEAAKLLMQSAIERFKSLDILVNNAGITRDGLAMSMDASQFEAVIDTNLNGAFYCCKAAMRQMMKQRSGRIINLSSVVALRGNPGQANYCASKAGLIGMSKALARELAPRGITVNAIAPGYIETDMTDAVPDAAKEALLASVPLKRAGRADEVAACALYFASEQAAYITGQVLAIDGGMGM